MVRHWATLAAVIGLAGCKAVGPDYRIPDAALVRAPAAQAAFVAKDVGVSAEPLPDQWWRLYDDARLDALVTQALAANTDLRAANANLARSVALERNAEAARQVQAGISAQTTQEQRSAEQVLQHVQPPERELYDIGAGVSYDLDLFGGIRRGIEAANADSAAVAAARDLVAVNVAAETARAWAEICSTGARIAVARRSIAIMADDVRLTNQTVRHGRAAAFEAERRSGALDATRARLPALVARQQAASFRLAALLGLLPAQADPAWLRCDRPLRPGRAIPVGDGRALLARRPDVRMAERHLAADTARIGVATAALYPDIRLIASVGSTGAAKDALSPLTNRFAFGPQVVWTINRSAVRARIAASRAGADADLATFDGTVLKALREVETALAEHAAVRERQAQLQRALTEADDVAAQTEALHRGGRIGGPALVAARRDANAAEQVLADVDAEVNAAEIALFLALGGGWQGMGSPGQ